jgi:mannose-6-phosphate isomerase-like protein (cupin superfamily)
VTSESSGVSTPGSHSISRVTPELIIDSNGGVAFEDGPDRGRVLISGESTDNAYSLMELTVAIRGGEVGFGPHLHHDIEELFVVRKGTLEFLLGSDVTHLSEGDAVRVPPGVRHGYRNTSGAPVELLVWFTPGGFEQLFVTYRTDQPNLDEEGFVAEATGRVNSQFE